MNAEQLGYLVLGLGTLIALFFVIYTPIKSHKDEQHNQELANKLKQKDVDFEEAIARMKADALLEAQSLQTTAENTLAIQQLTIEMQHQTMLWTDAIQKNSETHVFFRKKLEGVDGKLAAYDKRIAINEKEISRLGKYHPPERSKIY